jgi:hypothetical protein
MKTTIVIIALLGSFYSNAQSSGTPASNNATSVGASKEAKAAQPKSEPFAWGDFSWVQGNNRQKNTLLDTKYLTGSFTLDCN